MPFGGHLHSGNRWVQLAKLIPWEKIEKKYEKNFAESGMGAPAKSVRIALGALIIKERLKLSDEETVEQIRRIHTCNISWATWDIKRKRHLKRR